MNAIKKIPFETMCVLPKFVRKRTQELADFNSNKIYEAIRKATEACKDTSFEISCAVEDVCQTISVGYGVSGDIPTIEQVQDIVELVLMKYSPETAQAYIRYRTIKTEKRTANSSFIKGVVEGYINNTDWRVRENSNMSISIQGAHNHMSTELSKHYVLENKYPEYIANAHRGGDLHLHDLGFIGSYCVGWDLRDFLLKGYSGVADKVVSTPPRHFRTALDQIVNFLFTTQGETAGAQALSSVDTYLAPFIRADELTYPEVLRAVRAWIFGLNVSVRVGLMAN